MDMTKDLLLVIFERVCHLLFAADADSHSASEGPTSYWSAILRSFRQESVMDPDFVNSADKARYYQETSWCSISGFFLLELFGSNMNYILHGGLITLVWYIVPKVFGFLENLIFSRLCSTLATNGTGGFGFFESLWYAGQHRIAHLMKLSRRPKIANRQSKWDLMGQSHRSYTEQKIKEYFLANFVVVSALILRQGLNPRCLVVIIARTVHGYAELFIRLVESDEYCLKTKVFGTVKAVPETWEWKKHYKRYVNGSTTASTSAFPERKIRGANNITMNTISARVNEIYDMQQGRYEPRTDSTFGVS